MIIFADGALTARSYVGRHGQHVDAGQELLAFGAAQAAAGLLQAFPVGASGSRTAVSDAAGVRTQVAGLLAALIVCCVLLSRRPRLGAAARPLRRRGAAPLGAA